MAVLYVLGLFLGMFSAGFALPLIVSLITRDGMAVNFLLCGTATLALGMLLRVAAYRRRREIKARESFSIVVLLWAIAPIFATGPLLLALPQLSFTDAYFEAVSGLTTDGATVLSGLDSLPHSLNFWRHALHWYGGLGFIVLAVAVMPLLGVGGMQLYRAEMPAALKSEKLAPTVAGTAKSVLRAYLLITALAIAVLWLAGMSLLDAICHAFSAVALGGFSTRDSSVGYYDSVLIELSLCAVMVIAALSFARHFLAMHALSLRAYAGYSEGKAIVLVLAAGIAIVSGLVWVGSPDVYFIDALRHSAFNVISVATTTGFVTQDYERWPVAAPFLMLFLSCFVCAIGSTGGGVKMFRALVLARQSTREFQLVMHRRAMIPLRVGGAAIPEGVNQSVLAFLVVYFIAIAAGVFALTLSGLDFKSAFSAILACINTMGPGLGEVGPSRTFSSLSDFQTWVCTIAMIVGRLEVFTVLVLLTPAYWTK